MPGIECSDRILQDEWVGIGGTFADGLAAGLATGSSSDSSSSELSSSDELTSAAGFLPCHESKCVNNNQCE